MKGLDEMNAMKKLEISELSQEDIDLKIRAFWFPPYDGAFIEVNGKKYTLVNNDILKQLQDKDATAIV